MTATDGKLVGAASDEAPEIDAGKPVEGPVYLAKSTEEGFVVSDVEVEPCAMAPYE